MYEAVYDICVIAGIIFLLGGVQVTVLTFFDGGPKARDTRGRIRKNQGISHNGTRRIP